MPKTENNSKNESRPLNNLHQPESGKRWTLLYIGNHGRAITLKRFKGMVIVACLILCVSVASTVGLLYLGLNIRTEKNRLKADLQDLKAQIKTLRYEKDVLMTKLVLAESRSKHRPLSNTPNTSESEILQQNPAVSKESMQSAPIARAEDKPPAKKKRPNRRLSPVPPNPNSAFP